MVPMRPWSGTDGARIQRLSPVCGLVPQIPLKIRGNRALRDSDSCLRQGLMGEQSRTRE
jgi:hypothetical protein